MKKIVLAAILATTPAPAYATTVGIDLDRLLVIREAAPIICRQAVDEPGEAGPLVLQKARYLRLNEVEELYLMNLCILYIYGRQDQADKQRTY